MEREIIRAINVDEINKVIRESSSTSKIYIGCDSQQSKKNTVFGLAIVIHIDSQHGGRLFVEISRTPRITSLRQRLMTEVEIAVGNSYQFLDAIGNRPFEIHLDINPDPKHKSNIVCNEAIGYVVGQGFNCKVKPDSFVATHCADHFVRG